MIKNIALLLFAAVCPELLAQTTATIDYKEDISVFANPERGFYHHTEVHTSNYIKLNPATLRQYRENESITQILRVFYLEDFREKPISEQYLNNMRSDFNATRMAGLKVIVRFAYARSMSKPYNDATPEVVLMHIEQLKPVLRENSDVIAVVQAGFVGAWGEWYYTDHFAGLTPGHISEENWADRKKVVEGLLDALPVDRSVQIRTPGYKMIIFDREESLDSEEAYSGTDYARVGHHNDCFVASSSDFGTYKNPDVEKPYLEQETKYLPMGGETCALSSYSDCEFATEELERFHWSYLNIDYNRDVLEEWEDQGCFDEVERRLGYRFRLLNSNIVSESKPNGIIGVSLQMINDGYSSPYNPRGLELVLKNIATGEEFYLDLLDLEEDPRRWPVNEEFGIEINAGLPEEISEGNYQIFLHLPDPRPLLYKNADYSIRFANEDVWDPTLGYNDLGVTISVSDANVTELYTGENIFTSRLTENNFELEGSGSIYGASDENSMLIFWGRQPGYQRIIERSSDGTNYEQIAAINGALDFYKDTEVEEGTPYTYRYYIKDGLNVTTYSETINLTLSTATPEITDININGEDQDWNTIPPISTAIKSETYALRTFFDATKANFILYGPVNDYEIYLNTDNNSETGVSFSEVQGMDYLIRNDSLFSYSDDEWLFTEQKVVSSMENELLELSINHSLFNNLDSNPSIGIYAYVNQKEVVLADQDGSSAIHVRMPPPDLPDNFSVNNSENYRESRLVLEWEKCTYCIGIRIERSEDGSNFQEIEQVPSSITLYNDEGLTNHQTYYYRLVTYNELGDSDYSEVVEGTVGLNPLSVKDDWRKLLLIYPNPTSDYLIIEYESEKNVIYNLQGEAVLSVEKTSRIDVKSLKSGIYILHSQTAEGLKATKFVKQ